MFLTSVLVFFVIFAVYHAALWRFVRPRLAGFGMGLFVLLAALHLTLLTLHLLVNESGLFEASIFARWYVYYSNGEFNLPASFSSVQFLLVGLLAASIAVRAQVGRWHRLFWSGVSLMFAYLAADEYFMLHESFKSVWMQVYVAMGSLYAVTMLLALRRHHDRRNIDVFVLMVGGLALGGTGAVLLEKLLLDGCYGLVSDQICGQSIILEEMFENMGVLAVIFGALVYARRYVPATAYNGVRRTLVAGGLVWATAALAFFWVSGPFTVQVLATPVDIGFQDLDLRIVGFSASPVVTSGDALSIDVYWQTQTSVPIEFGITAQLIDHRDGTPLVRAEGPLLPNVTSARVLHRTWEWLPGVIHKTSFTVDAVPPVTSANRYWLTLTTWEDLRPDFRMQRIDQSDRQLVTDDMAILTSIPVLPNETSPALEHASGYRFGDDLVFTGYSAPTQVSLNERLTFRFGWRVTKNLERNPHQFLHFVRVDEDGLFSGDRPLLGNIFPFPQWSSSLETVDVWDIDLPEGMQPGIYRVYTGLYDVDTLERWSILKDDQPLPDDFVELGELHVV